MKRLLFLICACCVLLLAGLQAPAVNAGISTVYIQYRQIANFQSYTLGSGSHGAPSNGLFILYRIKKITNTGSAAFQFNFNPNKLYTWNPVKPKGVYVDTAHAGSEAQLLGGVFLASVTVKVGKIKSDPGLGCVIMVGRSTKAKDLATTSALVTLNYTGSGLQSVATSRVSGNTSTALIIGDATGAQLRSLCNSYK